MNDPVTMRRKLRVELKRLRATRELTQRNVAERLDWSQSKVIRIENGSVAVGVTDLQALLRLYGVDDQETIDSMVEMARGSKRLPFTDYKDALPRRHCASSPTSPPRRSFGRTSHYSSPRCFKPRSTRVRSSRRGASRLPRLTRSGQLDWNVRSCSNEPIRRKCSSSWTRPPCSGRSAVRQ